MEYTIDFLPLGPLSFMNSKGISKYKRVNFTGCRALIITFVLCVIFILCYLLDSYYMGFLILTFFIIHIDIKKCIKVIEFHLIICFYLTVLFCSQPTYVYC